MAKRGRPKKKDRDLRQNFPVAGNWMDELQKAEQAWQPWFEKASTSNDFYLGFQWSKGKEQQRTNLRRPTDTVNMIQSFVNIIVGSKRNVRLHPRAFPKREDALSRNTAEIITRLLKSIHDESDSREIDNRVFEDQVIQGRGGWYYLKGYNDEMKPVMYVKYQDQRQIIPDPNARDLQYRDARYIYRVSYYAKEQLMALFPKVDWQNVEDQVTKADVQQNDINFKNGLHRVIERFELKRESYDYYASLSTGEPKFRMKSTDSVAKILQEDPDLFMIENKTDKVLYYSIIIPTHSTSNAVWAGKHDLQIGRYPFAFAHAYVGDKGSFGVVENMIDTQRRMNTIRSLMVEILSKIPLQPWFVEDGSLKDGEEDFEEMISKSGAVIKIRRGFKPPVQPQHLNIPPALREYNALLDQDFRQTTGITPASEGRSEGANEPAALFRQKLAQTNRTLAVILDRYDGAQQYKWQSISEAIGGVYTEEDVITIGIDESFDPMAEEKEGRGFRTEPMEINRKETVVNEEGKAVEVLLNSVGDTLNRYVINLEMVEAGANELEENFRIIGEFIRNVGDPILAQILTKRLLRTSNLPKAHKIVVEYEQALQAQAQAQQQKEQAELQLEGMQVQSRARKNTAEANKIEAEGMQDYANLENTLAMNSLQEEMTGESV